MNECKEKKTVKAVAPTQTVRPEFLAGHVYHVVGTMFTGLDSYYLACKTGGNRSLYSMADGNRWSTHRDGPFGSDDSTHHIWTDVTDTVCINTGE